MEKEIVGNFIVGPLWEQIGYVTGVSVKCLGVKYTALFSGNCSWQAIMETKWAMRDKLFISKNCGWCST